MGYKTYTHDPEVKLKTLILFLTSVVFLLIYELVCHILPKLESISKNENQFIRFNSKDENVFQYLLPFLVTLYALKKKISTYVISKIACATMVFMSGLLMNIMSGTSTNTLSNVFDFIEVFSFFIFLITLNETITDPENSYHFTISPILYTFSICSIMPVLLGIPCIFIEDNQNDIYNKPSIGWTFLNSLPSSICIFVRLLCINHIMHLESLILVSFLSNLVKSVRMLMLYGHTVIFGFVTTFIITFLLIYVTRVQHIQKPNYVRYFDILWI
ncbi:hypothetical protein EON71_00045 [bacterium]|nr:MAG: hypothetical protein EON71_00045 [bacterium]